MWGNVLLIRCVTTLNAVPLNIKAMVEKYENRERRNSDYCSGICGSTMVKWQKMVRSFFF